MKRRLCALTICIALLLGVSPAWADAGSMEHFSHNRVYDGRFTDVTEDRWFYNNIVTLYELGLTEGQTADFYGAASSLKLSEALSFAARVHSTYYLGDAEAGALQFEGEPDHWYTPYVWYLQSVGIIADQFAGLYDETATRAQTAFLLSSVLPEQEFTSINDTAVTVGYATHFFITDVDDYTPYQQEILQLYKWGILNGSDDSGSFHPDAPIARSEFAAMLTRIIDPTLRIRLPWDVSFAYSAKDVSYSDLISDGNASYPNHDPQDLAAVDANIRHMLMIGSNTVALRYDKSLVTAEFVTQLMDNYLHTIRSYIEQGYNAVSCSYSASSGVVTFRFSSSLFSDRAFATAQSETLKDAIELHDHLWDTGVITSSMTEWEKAMAYYVWICDNCTYDHRATDTSLSHSAYSLFTMGSAVCDGYTAAYNLLLKLEGIQCSTASTADHIWTTAVLDGVEVHIDTTWGDQTGTRNDLYFGMTPDFSLSRFA